MRLVLVGQIVVQVAHFVVEDVEVFLADLSAHQQPVIQRNTTSLLKKSIDWSGRKRTETWHHRDGRNWLPWGGRRWRARPSVSRTGIAARNSAAAARSPATRKNLRPSAPYRRRSYSGHAGRRWRRRRRWRRCYCRSRSAATASSFGPTSHLIPSIDFITVWNDFPEISQRFLGYFRQILQDLSSIRCANTEAIR